MTKEPITISFVGDTEQKALLEQWAAADDRSVSYILRRIIAQEAQRRQTQKEQKPTRQATH